MTTSCDDQFSCIHRNVSGLSEISYFWGCFRAHGAADFLKYVHIVNVQQRQDLRRNTTLSYTWRRDDRRQRLAIIEKTPEKARQSTSPTTPCGLPFLCNVYIRKSCDLIEIDRSNVAADAG